MAFGLSDRLVAGTETQPPPECDHGRVPVRLTAARIGIVAAGVVWGSFTAVWAFGLSDAWLWTTDAAVVVAFAVVAAIALPSAGGTSVLAASVAVTWSIVAFAPVAVYWHRAALILLVLAAPRLWPRDTFSRIVVMSIGAASVTPYVWSADGAAIALTVGLAASLIVVRRRLSTQMLAAAWTATALFGAAGVWRLLSPDAATLDLRALVYSLGLIAIACTVAASAARSPSAILADDVIWITATPQDLRARMAAAVGDPQLRLAWWDAERFAFLDISGHRVSAEPTAGSAAIRVPLADRGEALIVCSRAVAADPRTRDSLTRATVLATEASRLDEELAQRIEEVARSSERLLLAGDAERREVRRLLDVDVARPLEGLGARLATARGSSAAAARSLERAAVLFDRCARQLQDVSLGLPPSELDAGLTDALEVLRAAAPLPVAVHVDPAVDDLSITTALFYVCAEALSNAVKHARASHVTIDVDVDVAARTCRVRIADDGCGGAEVGNAGGLAGIRDRVGALGGRLDVRSPESGGTSVEVSMPLSAGGSDTDAASRSIDMRIGVVG